MNTTDMNTAGGMIEHLRTLPTANLRAIAARDVWAGNAAMILAAETILTEREV
jgi:hypothetical protein